MLLHLEHWLCVFNYLPAFDQLVISGHQYGGLLISSVLSSPWSWVICPLQWIENWPRFGKWTRKLPQTDFAAAAKSLQSCPTLCNPIDSSPPGSPIAGILEARTLEWVAISFSNAWKWSHVRRFATPWTAAYQAPPSMGFSRQEYWSGVSLPSPRLTLTCSYFQPSLRHFC